MNRILFLTSTVSPSNINFVGSKEQRRLEYIRAVNFYLEETNFLILIVDNSGYDFNQDFNNNKRIECLAYKADDHSAFGKGYGELSLIKYGFEHSHFLLNADQIIKVTGRHIIKNINRLMVSCTDKNAVYVDVDLKLSFAMTYFFVSSKEFYNCCLFPNLCKLNDRKGYYLEHLVAEALNVWMLSHHKFHEFKYPIYLKGHQGASLKSYRAPGILRYLKIRLKYIIRELMNTFTLKTL